MFRRSKKKQPASTLGRVITTLEKQAASPTGLATLRYLAPRVLPVVAPIVLSFFSLGGTFPGCKATSTGPLPEVTQSIHIDRPTNAAVNAPKNTVPIQLTAAKTSPPPMAPPNLQKTPNAPYAAGRDVVFAFWNCENFFDDQDDHRTGPGDRDYDPWLARNRNILQLKLDKMTEAILSINGGKGPDILAVCEVESVRAMQLLQWALNTKLADPNLQYRNIEMKEMNSGRHIAPAVLTRLPINTSRTRVLGSRQRILQCHLLAGDKELIVIASHWTSRLDGGGPQRMNYAQSIYGAANAIYLSNPQADIILCGDFNDNPTDDSVVKGLHATANPSEAKTSTNALRFVNLFGAWQPNSGAGSLYYQGWNQFDQILVSPGLFDTQGWSVDPSSIRVVNSLIKPGDRNRRPWRFGGEKETGARGFSDHFPVCVHLIARP
jgi:endonuclease/exonuclease/phosphatase family metal-dependent hydrolase